MFAPATQRRSVVNVVIVGLPGKETGSGAWMKTGAWRELLIRLLTGWRLVGMLFGRGWCIDTHTIRNRGCEDTVHIVFQEILIAARHKSQDCENNRRSKTSTAGISHSLLIDVLNNNVKTRSNIFSKLVQTEVFCRCQPTLENCDHFHYERTKTPTEGSPFIKSRV